MADSFFAELDAQLDSGGMPPPELPAEEDDFFAELDQQLPPEPPPQAAPEPKEEEDFFADLDRMLPPEQSASTPRRQGGGYRRAPSGGGGKVDPGQVYSYLLDRGVSPVHAVGMINNIQHESGFDAGINERSPLVKGSRGGFGLFQHTGPRRRQLEAFARQMGRPVSDWQTQLEFALQEGDTRKYLSKEFGSPEAASYAFTTEWERPQHKEQKGRQRLASLNQYTGLMESGGAGYDPYLAEGVPPYEPGAPIPEDIPREGEVDQQQLLQELEGLFTTQVEPSAPDVPERGDIMAGFMETLPQAQQLGYGAATIAGDALGWDWLKDWGLEGYQEKSAELEALSEGRTRQLEDIEGVGDFFDYAQYMVGQGLGSFAEYGAAALAGSVLGSAVPGAGTVAGGVAGAAGKVGLKKLLDNRIRLMAAKGIKKGMAKDAALDAARKGMVKKIGAGASVLGYGYLQGVGDIGGEFINEDGTIDENAALTSFTAAVPYALLDKFTEAGFFKKIIKPSEAESIAKRALAEAPKAAASEAITEALQDVAIKMGSATLAGQEYTGQEYLSALANSMAGGALMGAPMGAVQAVPRTEAQAEAERLQERREGWQERQRGRVEDFSQQVETVPETRADEQAAITAVQDGRKVAGQVLRPESVQAAKDAGLVTIEVDNGTLVTTPENEAAVREAEEAGERYRVLGYAEDKTTALQDPGAVMVRPVQADGASPGAQLASAARVADAEALAEAQAGEGGSVEVISVEEELARRLAPKQEAEMFAAVEPEQQAEDIAKQEAEAYYRREQEEAGEREFLTERGTLPETDEERAEREWAEAEPPATEAAKAWAKKNGIDLRDLTVEGRQITKGDVQKAIAAKKPPTKPKVTSIEEAREKKQHAKDVAAQKAAEAAPTGEVTPDEFTEAAERLAAKIAEPPAERELRRDEGEVFSEAVAEVKARPKQMMAFGEGQEALDRLTAYIDKRREYDEADKKKLKRQPRMFKAPQYAEALKDMGPAIRATRDAVLKSPLANNPETVALANAGTQLAARAAKLDPTIVNEERQSIRHGGKMLRKLEADIRAWKDQVDKLKVKRETKTVEEVTKPQPNRKVTAKQKVDEAREWKALLEDGLLSAKQIVAARGRGLTPQQAWAESKGEEIEIGVDEEPDWAAAAEGGLSIRTRAEEKAAAKAAKEETGAKVKVVTKKKRPKVSETDREAELAKLIAEQTQDAAEVLKRSMRQEERRSEVSTLPEAGREDILDARDAAASEFVLQNEEMGLTQADDVIRNLIDTLDTADPYRHLLERIYEKGLGDLDIHVLPDAEVQARMEDPLARAGYIAGTDRDTGEVARQILISESVADSREGLKSLIHELVHASMNESLRTDNQLARDMEALRKVAARRLGKYNPETNTGYYGLANVDEFMAEALTNADFQRALAGVKTKGNASLWQRFVAAVRNFLGLEVDSDSVLAHVLSAAPDLMLTGAETETRMADRSVAPYIADVTAAPTATQAAESIMWSERRSALRTPAERIKPYVVRSPQGSAAWNFARAKTLALQTTDQLVRRFQGRMQALREWQNANQRRTSIARTMQQTSEGLNNRWRELERNHPQVAQRLAKLMHDATMQGNDPKKTGSSLHNDWRALPPEAKQVYNDVEKFYQDQRHQMKSALLKRVVEFRVAGPGVRGIQQRLTTLLNQVPPPTTKQIDAAFRVEMANAPKDLAAELDKARLAAREVVKLSGVRGPYFPLRRWGEYVVNGENPQGEQYTEFFETEQEAQEAHAQRTAAGYKLDPGVSLKRDWGASGLAENAPQLLSMISSKFAGDKSVQGQVENAIIQLLAENNLRKSELQRKGVEGASLNMRRAFAERAFAGSWAIADASTAFERAEALTNMEKQAQGRPDLGEVVRELRMRESKALQERKISPIDQFLSKFGFMWYLASPSYALVNASQVPLVAIPYLSGKYGVGNTMAAYKDNVGLITGAARQTFDWYRRNAKTMFSKEGNVENPPTDAWQVMSQGFNPAQKAMIKVLQEKGIIDTTFAQELFEAASDKEIVLNGKKGLSYAWSRAHVAGRDALSWSRAAPQAVEAYNRVITAKMAFDLEMKKSGDTAKATQVAEDAVYETQFDYSDQNKPRYFKPIAGARALFMFKMYAQGIYSLMATNAAKAWKGDKEAMKTLGLLATSHSLAGGLMSGFFVEPLRLLASIFGDDDEWEREWKNMTADALGKDMANLLNHGIPRGIGIDLSSRVGLDNIMFMDLRGQTYEEKWKNFIVQLGGPIVAAGLSMVKGADYISEGQHLKAAQSFMPKRVRDALKAYEEQTKGLTSRTGEKIDVEGDYTAWDALMRGFVGFAPSRTSEGWERRIGGMAAYQEGRGEADVLRRRFVNATPRERVQMLRGEIREFNRENPEFFLKPENLWKSVRDRAKREREQISGYYVEQRKRAWLQEQVRY